MGVAIPKKAVKGFLEKRLKKPVQLVEYKKLGSGWHGIGYKIRFKTKSSKKTHTVILREISPEGFSHDFHSDRAAVFILQHSLSETLPKHIKSYDVGGIAGEKVVSLGECKEFFQIVEVAEGRDYFSELDDILKRGYLTKEDKRKTLMLSNYLVSLYKKQFKGKKSKSNSIYLRHTRDCVGNGEMLMGVIDTYPRKLSWTNEKELTEIITLAVKNREGMKDKRRKLTRIHGDYHPGNIIFKGKNFKVLDASREIWGDPADDLTCMFGNYLRYALIQKGKWEGIFKELGNLFWENYMKKTKDYGANISAPIFFGFRGVVMAHPFFYRQDKPAVKKKLFKFVKNVLKEKRFDYKKVGKYLQ